MKRVFLIKQCCMFRAVTTSIDISNHNAHSHALKRCLCQTEHQSNCFLWSVPSPASYQLYFHSTVAQKIKKKLIRVSNSRPIKHQHFPALANLLFCVRTIFAHLFASLMLCLGWLNSFSLPKSSKCKQNLLINASYAQLWTTQLSISNIIGVANRISVSLGRYWDCGANYFSLMKDILTLSLQAINIDLLKKQIFKLTNWFHFMDI